MRIAVRTVSDAERHGSPLEVLLVLLGLGMSCFGSPAAHIGYFRAAFVE
jgi:chromate transporter